MNNIIETMEDNYIFAVISGKSEQDGYEIAKAATAGGIKNIEITDTTPNTKQVIEK